MNKLQVVDFSDRLNEEGKYKLDVSGYSGYGKGRIIPTKHKAPTWCPVMKGET